MIRALVVALLLVPAVAHAERAGGFAGRFGLGLQLGEPFAVTGKYWLNGKSALQGSVGSFRDDVGDPLLTFDWVYMFAEARPQGGGVSFGFHVGVGGAIAFTGRCYRAFGSFVCDRDDPAIAARIPIAANMYIDTLPLEVFLELTPIIGVLPGVYSGWGSGLGARWYF